MEYKITTRDERETIQIAQNLESEKFENMVKDNDYKFQYFFFHRPNITEKYKTKSYIFRNGG